MVYIEVGLKQGSTTLEVPQATSILLQCYFNASSTYNTTPTVPLHNRCFIVRLLDVMEDETVVDMNHTDR